MGGYSVHGSEHSTIIYYVSFILFLSFVALQGAPTVLGEGSPDEITEPPFEDARCDIGGWGALIDAVKCGIDIGLYFQDLLFGDSPFQWLNFLVLLPLSIGILWLIAKLVRGN